jgi:hypothetical protein
MEGFMLFLVATTALAFALNAEPAPKPYGPAVQTDASAVRISPASESKSGPAQSTDEASRSHDDDADRAYVCVDDKCKTVSPVYNTRTPMEADARSFRASW